MQKRENKTFIRSFAFRQSTKEMLETLAIHYDRTQPDLVEYLIREAFKKISSD